MSLKYGPINTCAFVVIVLQMGMGLQKTIGSTVHNDSPNVKDRTELIGTKKRTKINKGKAYIPVTQGANAKKSLSQNREVSNVPESSTKALGKSVPPTNSATPMTPAKTRVTKVKIYGTNPSYLKNKWPAKIVTKKAAGKKVVKKANAEKANAKKADPKNQRRS